MSVVLFAEVLFKTDVSIFLYIVRFSEVQKKIISINSLKVCQTERQFGLETRTFFKILILRSIQNIQTHK